MIQRIINFSVRAKMLVFMGTAAIAAWGLYSAFNLPIDAVPDITNNQVQVVTTAPALAPQEVEQFITYPVELAMANLAGVEEVRSVSRYGLSVVTVVFGDEVDNLAARQRVNEQIDQAAGQIPPGIERPGLMPITTGLGEIYQYTLEVDPRYRYDLAELRSIHDWQIKRQLSGIPGVVELSSFGGKLKQYEVAVNPDRLSELGLTMADVFDAVTQGNQNAGGAYIEKSEEAWYIRLEGLYQGLSDIEHVALRSPLLGTPVLVRDIAEVSFGAAPRYGALTRDGKGEAVGGIFLMLKGANSYEVTQAIEDRMAQIAPSLPPGIRIEPYLNRSDLVGRALSTVSRNLIEGGLIVVLVLIVLLGNLRAGLVVASVIPLALLFALACMRWAGVSANLMSLGAIDFGIVVDGAVIVVEAVLAAMHGKARMPSVERDEVVARSAGAIYQSAAFGVLIILVVFVPILSLTGIEGKMFRPMAQTVGFALVGALIFSVTYVPALAALVLKPGERENRSERVMHQLRVRYAGLLNRALNRGGTLLSVALALFVGAVLLFQQLGSVFIPSLEEGDLAMQLSIPTGSNLDEMTRITTQAEQRLMAKFPEVKHVVSKIGTAEVPTDPMPMEAADVMILLKPKSEWTSAETREELVAQMEAELTNVWGALFEFTQPIQLRFNELISGSKSDIALQLYGDDLDTLAVLAARMASAVEGIPGAADVKVEATQGMRFYRWVPDRQAMAYHGIALSQVSQAIEHGFAGGIAGTVYEGQKRFDVAVRLDSVSRRDGGAGTVMLRSANGDLIPLTAVAQRVETVGPSQISRSQTSRRISVGINVRERDVASVVADIESKLAATVKLPTGYRLHIGGDFENLRAAVARLQVAVPVALVLIFVLLYLTFRSAAYAAVIFSAIPLSAVGGVAFLALRGMPFSISAGIGFIALFGVVVLNGIVLASRVRDLSAEGLPWREAVVRGSADRLRAVLMTATVAALGFVPMAFSTSAGAEVQKPLATVVIGGLVSATLLTLGILPVLLLRFERWLAKGVMTLLLLGFAAFGASAQQAPSLGEAVRAAQKVHARAQLAVLEVARAKAEPSVVLGNGQLTAQYGQMNAADLDRYVSYEQPLGSIAQHVARSQRNAAAVDWKEAQAEAQLRAVERDVALLVAEYEVARGRLAFAERIHSQLSRDAGRIQARVDAGEWSATEGRSAQLALDQWQVTLARLEAQLQELVADLATATGLAWPLAPQVLTPQAMLLDADTTLHPALVAALEGAQRTALADARLVGAEAWSPQWSVGGFRQQLEKVPGFQGLVVGLSVPLDPAAQARRRQSRISSAMAEVEAEYSARQMRQDFAAQRANAARWALRAPRQDDWTTLDQLFDGLSAQLREGEVNFYEYRLAQSGAWDLAQAHFDAELAARSAACMVRFYQSSHPSL
ncbi:MAG: CusA/CzcA family heavy metal efflux RND transporter [Schleiferiaceae bacterium]